MRGALGEPVGGFTRGLEVGEFFVVVAGCEEDMAGGYGHDIEECEDVWSGEDEVALRVDLLWVWGGRYWGG